MDPLWGTRLCETPRAQVHPHANVLCMRHGDAPVLFLKRAEGRFAEKGEERSYLERWREARTTATISERGWREVLLPNPPWDPLGSYFLVMFIAPPLSPQLFFLTLSSVWENQSQGEFYIWDDTMENRCSTTESRHLESAITGTDDS